MTTNPLTAHPLDELREEADEWLIRWEDGNSRETTLAVIAWYAREFDEEVEVVPL